jgi:hypothetical protein
VRKKESSIILILPLPDAGKDTEYDQEKHRTEIQ